MVLRPRLLRWTLLGGLWGLTSLAGATSAPSRPLPQADWFAVAPASARSATTTPTDWTLPAFAQAVHRLERTPLMQQNFAERAAMMRWVADTPKLTLNLAMCPHLVPLLPSTDAANEADGVNPLNTVLFSQYVLGMTAHLIEHPQADQAALETAGLVSLVHWYALIRPTLSRPHAQVDRWVSIAHQHGEAGLRAQTCAASAPTPGGL